MTINRDSPEFMLGTIITELKVVSSGLSELKASVNNLPCAEESLRLKAIEIWQKACVTKQSFSQSFRSKLYLGIFIAAISGFVSFLFSLLV